MLVFFNYIGFFTSVLFSMSVFKWCQLWKNNVKKPFCFQFQFLISFNFFTFWFAINHYSIILKGSNKTQQALCKYNQTNTSFFPNKYLVNVRQVSNKKRVTSLWVFIQNVTSFWVFVQKLVETVVYIEAFETLLSNLNQHLHQRKIPLRYIVWIILVHTSRV